jgi:NAD(P)-dependent dehydrogenase (short-subunit alcohol dehydrogenase family)
VEKVKFMQGKTVLITGADGGIGRKITMGLAQKGATIVMACINLDEARPVWEEIKRESGNENIEMMQVDLASLNSVRSFTREFPRRYQQLHVLINNAGTYHHTRQETAEGFERTIGINYLGPFLLTNILLPVICQTPASRIINVSSNAHFQGRIDVDDLHFQGKNYHGFKAYSASKVAIVLFTRELAECTKGSDVTVNALHPGHVATNIWNIWPGTWYQKLIFKIFKTVMTFVEDAAQNSIYLASAEEVQGVTGKYFDGKKMREPSSLCKDVHLQKSLWELSEKLTGLS